MDPELETPSAETSPEPATQAEPVEPVEPVATPEAGADAGIETSTTPAAETNSETTAESAATSAETAASSDASATESAVESVASNTNPADVDFLTQLAGYFQDGGAFMWPLAILLVIGLAIAIERAIFLIGARSRNRRFWNKVQPKLQQQDFRGAAALCEDSSTATSHILAYGIGRLNAGAKREDVETAMEEGLMEQLPRLEKRTHYLATLANIATLLGLLGTIWGMIGAFSDFLSTQGDAKTAALSSSISVAMLTTAFGLIIAIPLLLSHAWLQSRTNELVDSLEMAAVKFLNLIKR